MYADSNDRSTFTWTGTTTSASDGIVYLPNAPLVMSNASNAKVINSQIIAKSFNLSGNNSTTVNYKKYVDTKIPAAYLVQ